MNAQSNKQTPNYSTYISYFPPPLGRPFGVICMQISVLPIVGCVYLCVCLTPNVVRTRPSGCPGFSHATPPAQKHALFYAFLWHSWHFFCDFFVCQERAMIILFNKTIEIKHTSKIPPELDYSVALLFWAIASVIFGAFAVVMCCFCVFLATVLYPVEYWIPGSGGKLFRPIWPRKWENILKTPINNGMQ